MTDQPASDPKPVPREKNHPVLPAMASSNPRSPPTKEQQLRNPSSPTISHRASFTESLRGVPPSPRAQRQPSLSQQALQDLINNPPAPKNGNSKFSGRDWRTVQVGEIIDSEQVRFVEMETSVEDATKVLTLSGRPNVVLLRENKDSKVAIGTFDYNDLNSYLLLVIGLAQPGDDQITSFNELVRKGREGKTIPLKDIKELGKKEPLITLPQTANLTKAVEIFGSGIHRIVIVKEHSMEVVGILTQLRLVQFFWENGRNFPAIDNLYQHQLKDLNIGSNKVFAINGDKPLTNALELMHNEGITSLPVLDNQKNVIGNISHVDVRLLTKSTSLPLLRSSCIHFISVILSERGMDDGKDSFPVFHVNPWSTLAHTVAKLVATRSHRMWIVETPTPPSSGPPTPITTPATLVPPPLASPSLNPTTGPPYTPNPASTISTTPGAAMGGRLSGVVSLTDILNTFARASGLSPHDPDETRRARRRSSSSLSRGRRSVDSSRSESLVGSEVGGDRKPSVSRRRP